MAIQRDESEFRNWRNRYLKRAFVFCVVGFFAGFFFALSSPWITIYVSGLSLLGGLICGLKLLLSSKSIWL